jgi:hypothetical protein
VIPVEFRPKYSDDPESRLKAAGYSRLPESEMLDRPLQVLTGRTRMKRASRGTPARRHRGTGHVEPRRSRAYAVG